MIRAVEHPDPPVGLGSIVGDSPGMRALKQLLARVAASRATTVLIGGEPGVGKDLAARVIHGIGTHASQPFVKIACAGLPDLPANVEFAHDARGTLLLDEISDLSAALQVALLRFLESRGDVRVIAATTVDLKERVSAGTFREDLYYCLQVMPIVIPPLRDRRGDVSPLASFYIDLFNRELRKRVRGASPDAINMLQDYGWPGNVRELRNAIERAMLAAAGPWLQPEDFGRFPRAVAPADRFQLPTEGVNLEEVERRLLVQALERAGGNQTHAGELLGINRDQVRYRIEKFGLQLPGHERKQHV